MGKIIFISFILLILLMAYTSATAPSPEPLCRVEGTINSIEFKAAYNEFCVAQNNCPTDVESVHPDRYYLNVTIQEVSYLNGSTQYITCEQALPINTIKTIILDKNKAQNGIPVQGQIIEGTVTALPSPFHSSFVSYVLRVSNREYDSLQEYYDSIDYSCQVDNDCEIKDVHKCCGVDYYCVNEGAVVDADFVREACQQEGVSSTCDVNLIDFCKCKNNKCKGYKNNSDNQLSCEDYTYSNCPENCEKKCTPSSCSNGVCTTDCNGAGSCYTKIQNQECSQNSDCKLIYSNCDCEAVPNIDSRTTLDGKGIVCIWNYCHGTNITAICKNNKCKKSVEQNNTFTLSNGRKAEIKIMPETASQKAIARLGELGFNITLKEVGSGENAKIAYHLEAEKEYKILGFIKKKAKVSVEVNAETGDIIKIKKPWWSFLASDMNNGGCTKEAKMCPNGGSVSRNPSKNCEFDPCP